MSDFGWGCLWGWLVIAPIVRWAEKPSEKLGLWLVERVKRLAASIRAGRA